MAGGSTPLRKTGVDVVTFGCRLNASESEAMRARAAIDGVSNAVVFNT
jgi:threonylcarbamoyladenosine tRNA methylthiotransferase MtaB